MTEEHQVSVELENHVEVPLSPGAVLANARKKANLTVEEVASRLCLRGSVIEAIESDNYSGISRHVFARGYLRAYARFMTLDADKIIELFNALDLKEMSNERMLWQAPRSMPRKESPVKWLVILVVTFSCFLSVMLWNSNRTKVKSVGSEKISLLEPKLIPHKNLGHFIEQDTLGAYSTVKGKKS